MHENLGDHAEEEELDETNGETEASPVMSVFHGLKAVTLEVNVAVKVHLMESLHGDLVVTTVLESIGVLLEIKVVLDRASRETSLVILAGADGRDDQPEGAKDGDVDNESNEDGSLDTKAKLPAQVVGNHGQGGDEGIVVEGVGARAIGRERSILDGGEL